MVKDDSRSRSRAHAVRAVSHGARRFCRMASATARSFRDGRAQRQRDLIHHTFGIQLRHTRALSDGSLGPARRDPEYTAGALAARRNRRNHRDRHEQVSAVHFMSLGAQKWRRRSAGPPGSCSWRTWQPRLAPSRACEGCEPDFRMGGRDRARGQPVARRDEDRPRRRCTYMYPAPDGAGARGQKSARGHVFEEMQFLSNPAAEFAALNERAAGSLPGSTQAKVCVSLAGFRCGGHTTKSLTTKAAEWLRKRRYDPGQAAFRRVCNYGDDLMVVKQRRRVTVWPVPRRPAPR